MKKSFLVGALFLCLVTVLVTAPVLAQNQRIGTSAAPELLIPVGARDLAQGGASIASSQGLEAIYWNPAGLARLGSSAEGMFSSMSYIADIHVSYGAAGAKLGEFGTVGLSLKSLNIGDIPLTTVDDPTGATGGTFSPTYITVGLTYSRQVTDAASVGITAKFISESIARVAATGMAFDVGVQYHGLLNVKGLKLGVTIKNIGPQMQFNGSGLNHLATSSEGLRAEQFYASTAGSYDLPSLIEIGASYGETVQENMVYNLSTSFVSNNLYEDEYRIGGEFGFLLKDVSFFARAGYAFIPQVKQAEDRIFGATLGLGLTYNAGGTDITFDYAYRSVKYFDANSIISLKIGF